MQLNCGRNCLKPATPGSQYCEYHEKQVKVFQQRIGEIDKMIANLQDDREYYRRFIEAAR